MQPASACVGATRASKASTASASLPGSAVNDPTTTTSDMRCSSPTRTERGSYALGGDLVAPPINHVRINARDLQEAVDFYVALLGAELLTTPNFGIPVQWLAL